MSCFSRLVPTEATLFDQAGNGCMGIIVMFLRGHVPRTWLPLVPRVIQHPGRQQIAGRIQGHIVRLVESPRATMAAAAHQDAAASNHSEAAQSPPEPSEPASTTTYITSDHPLPTDHHAWTNAVVLVDKPKGWTSFDVCGKLRSVVKIEKVGHAGTLDPMATGLLVLCIGRATKQVDTFMGLHKEYTGTMRLGQGTPSQDADTEVNEEAPWEHITDDDLQAAARAFVGEIQQIPPMYSAIRVGGKRLYEAAREGQEVDRKPRSVTITALELTRDASVPQDVHFRVQCGKGTYVRTLAHDLVWGMHLGSRAHLTALRRTQNGTQRVEQAWQLGPLLEAVTGLGLPERRKTRKGGRRAGAKRQGVGKKEGGHGAQRGKLRQDVSSLRNGVE